MIEIRPGVHAFIARTKGRVLNESRMDAKGYTKCAAERRSSCLAALELESCAE